ncbi:MAG: sodium:proton antiporter, partial [Verrucomicrobiota bacterium]|nr:sodium:proton antiporter [Verrucomicrobiota bacterium]
MKNLTLWMRGLGLLLLLAGVVDLAAADTEGAQDSHGVDGGGLSVWWVLPFAGMLLSIALGPLVAAHFWHNHYGKVAAGWIAVFAVPFLVSFGGDAFYEILHIVLLDYVPFIILLAALFTAAGGICLKGSLRGSPMVNTAILFIGTVLASWMGTTGAAMLLIRPILRANAWRKHRVHVIVFFIFLVANIGGSLTPLGDPPLFLGFLKGVEFFWTMKLLPVMAPVSVALLVIFFIVDTLMFRKEGEAPDDGEKVPLKLEGGLNFVMVACIIGAILFSTWLGNNKFIDAEKSKQARDELPALVTIMETVHADLKKVDAALKSTDPVPDNEVKIIERSLHENVHYAEHHGHGENDPKTTAAKARQKKFEELPGEDRFVPAKLLPFHADVRKHHLHTVMTVNQQRADISYKETKGIPVLGVTVPFTNLVRDGLLLLIAFISLRITPMYRVVKDEHGHEVPAEGEEETNVRAANGFTWEPILEVAKLFIAIFVCMIPALLILKAGVDGGLKSVILMVQTSTNEPINAMYFWLTGALSSFLDNAPTYVVFFNTAGGDP